MSELDANVVVVVGLVAVLALALWAAWRANELFRIDVRQGRAELVRGVAPPGFLADVKSIVAGAGDGTIRGVKRDGRGTLIVSGLGVHVEQRLRNTYATYASRAGSRL